MQYRIGFPKVAPVKELTKFEKFLQRPIKEQDDIVRMWNGERFSNMQMLKLDKKHIHNLRIE